MHTPLEKLENRENILIPSLDNGLLEVLSIFKFLCEFSFDFSKNFPKKIN